MRATNKANMSFKQTVNFDDLDGYIGNLYFTGENLFSKLMQIVWFICYFVLNRLTALDMTHEPEMLGKCSDGYLSLSETPWGTPMLTVAESTLCWLIFRSAPYSTTVPKNPVLQDITTDQNHNIVCNQLQHPRTQIHYRISEPTATCHNPKHLKFHDIHRGHNKIRAHDRTTVPHCEIKRWLFFL